MPAKRKFWARSYMFFHNANIKKCRQRIVLKSVQNSFVNVLQYENEPLIIRNR